MVEEVPRHPSSSAVTTHYSSVQHRKAKWSRSCKLSCEECGSEGFYPREECAEVCRTAKDARQQSNLRVYKRQYYKHDMAQDSGTMYDCENISQECVVDFSLPMRQEHVKGKNSLSRERKTWRELKISRVITAQDSSNIFRSWCAERGWRE